MGEGVRSSPGDLGEAVAAGHVKRRPAFLVSLVNVGPQLHQKLDAGQVTREHGLVNGCHA